MNQFYLNPLGRWFKTLTIVLSLLGTSFGQLSAQYADCSTALITQGNTAFFNPSGVGTKLENLACGGVEHNSVWIAFQAKASGKLNFVIRPYTLNGVPTVADVDWSLFALTGAPNTGVCNAKTQLSCNFSGSATVFGIPGATGMATPNYTANQLNPGIDVVNGNWYMLIIDQFSNTIPLVFGVQFTGNPESPALNSSPGIFDDKPDFSYLPTAGCSGVYSFTNTSTATSGITSYLWDFGDGSTSTAANPSHTYLTTGTYYVTLTVTDNNGNNTTIRKSLLYNITAPVINNSGIFVTSSCSDNNNGTLTVTTTGSTPPGVTGGTPPYTFELVSPSAMIVPAQSSNVFTGLQAGGYTVKVTDACGRSVTNTTTVTVSQVATNTVIGLGIQNTQAACIGSATGTATIFANGTVPPYTMALVNSSPTLVAPITAVQRDPITATYYVTFTNLLPGSYTVEATDACGKKRRATFTVTASTAPIANSFVSPSCGLSPTGTLSVTATAATGLSGNGTPGNFEYALIAPSPIIRPFQSGSVFDNLLPGSYTIAVKDACGNIGISTNVVTTASSISLATSFTTPSCPNGATGTIEAQISSPAGGGGPYLFELVAPSPIVRPPQNSNTFQNLTPGTYTILLTDACGNVTSTTATVAASSAPSLTTTLTTSCVSPQNGSIRINPNSTNIEPFSFELISPGAAIRASQGSNIPNSTSSIFTNLAQGIYTVKMTDGCGTPITAAVTLSAPTALAFPTGSSSIPSCAASSTGRIVVAVPTTGLEPYQYELIAPSPLVVAPQNSRIFDNLPTGDYTIRITDACGTQATIGAPITVGISTVPSLTVTNTASCATASGTINALAATANQGGGTYQFSLIAPSPVIRPNQTSPLFTGLDAGAYTVQITDQCGLTGTITTTIATAGAFTPAGGGSIVSCNGSNYNAQIIVTTPQNFTAGGPIPTGSGGGPYTYAIYDATNTTLIAGPQSSNVFSFIIPVTGNPSHTIRVTDICGNTSSATLPINPPVALAAATISITASPCAGANTGVIRVSTASAGGLAPYQYTLIDAVTSAVVAGPQSSTTFNLVPANATGYLVRTTDACGNVATSATALLFPAAVTPTATVVTLPSCAASATGRITTTPGTGTTFAGGTFSYALYDAGNTTLIRPNQASPVFNFVAAGTYTVRITDRCGTEGTVSATVASGGTALTASGTATGTCIGGNTGVIVGSSTGGILPITYTLVDQATSNVIAGPQYNNIFSGLTTGTYIVRVTDTCGTITNSANIPLGNLSTTPTVSTSSALDCGGTATISAYGGGGNGGPYSYAICSGAGCTTFGSYTSNSQFTVSASDTYRISVQDRCGNTTNSGDIVISLPTQAVITGITKDVNCGPTTVTVTTSNVPNTPYYSVDGGNFAPSIGTLAVGTHTISVADYNVGNFGCASTASVITINAPSTANAGANTSTCVAGTTTLSPVGTGVWSGGAGTFSGNSYTPNMSESGSTVTLTWTVAGVGTCPDVEDYVNVTVIAEPPAPTLVASNNTPCSGTQVTLTATAASGFGAMEYLWYKNGTAINYQNGGTGTYIVNVGTNAGANDYEVKIVYSGYNCLSNKSATATVVTMAPNAIITPTGPTTFCANTPTTLNATVGMTTYVWKKGTTVVGTNSSAYIPTASGNHTVTVTDAAGCSKTSASTNITVKALPSANAGIDRNVCVGSSQIIGNSAVVGNTYTWSPATDLSATNVSNPTVVPSTATMTTYTLTVNGVNGCANTDMINIAGLASPSVPTLTGSATEVCQGANIVLTPNASGVSTILWLKNGTNLAYSLPTATRNITAPTPSADNYTIRAKAANGCFSAQSNAVSAWVKAAAIPTITSNPAAVGSMITVCVPGGTNGAASLTANSTQTGATYSWKQSGGYISGANTNTYTANVTTTANNKVFSVEATYPNGCTKNSASRTVRLVTTGCTPRSGEDKYDNSDLQEIVLESNMFSTYPNPTNGLLNVSVENSQATKGTLTIVNTLGQVVLQQEMPLTNGQGMDVLDLRYLAVGVYNISFQTEDVLKVQKVIKE